MGYTHYWQLKKQPTKAAWARFTDVVERILCDERVPALQGDLDWIDSTSSEDDRKKVAAYKRAQHIPDDYPDKPVANDMLVRFNGVGEDNYETFVMERRLAPGKVKRDDLRGFGFCKTARKPYDVAVTACLLAARVVFGATHVRISSDGGPEDWSAGLAVFNKAMPIGQIDIPTIDEFLRERGR